MCGVALCLKVKAGLGVEQVSGAAAEGERNRGADGVGVCVLQLGGRHDDDGIRAAGGDVEVDRAAHHFADVNLAADHGSRGAGEQQVLRTHAECDRAGLYVVLIEVCLLFVREENLGLVEDDGVSSVLLHKLGQQVEVPVYSELDSKDPVQIALNAIQEAKAKGYDLVIVDTAGRLAIDEQMMNEIEAIKKAINPDATLFVVDAMTGQDAVNTAREFNERLDFTGVVLTKLDGDTRGGAALSIRTVVNKPIMFVGTGEKLDAVDQFHPARMADRILGMGDIVSLVERAQEQYDEEEAKRLQKKIQKNQFDFNDFLTQIHQIKKMGNLKELASMIPGVGKAIKDIDIDDNAFKSIEAIIYSMTPEERTHPEILNGTRRTRIAKGSGTSIQEVNRLLKQFDQTRKMMKMVTGSKMAGMMQKMKKK